MSAAKVGFIDKQENGKDIWIPAHAAVSAHPRTVLNRTIATKSVFRRGEFHEPPFPAKHQQMGDRRVRPSDTVTTMSRIQTGTVSGCAPFQPKVPKKIDSDPARGQSFVPGGEMAEWFNAHAWKACIPKRYRGFESPSLRHISQGDSHADSRIDSRSPIPSCPDLARIVTVWEKLPAPLKAAILAIVKSAE